MSTETTTTTDVTTEHAIGAVAYERAPRYKGRTVNRRIICADDFRVSVQASAMHYAHDMCGEAPYWSLEDEGCVAYPFVTFEVGHATGGEVGPAEVWSQYDSGGVWAWVPARVVSDLLGAHGGAIAWEATPSGAP